ncbi:MAG TPA: transporter substrate-binding domain-containing protein, partial [Methanoregulaceae archaeon]|nr:transporter substrate-binding domain-containing protein [Methanoregulaceae archaeon]
MQRKILGLLVLLLAGCLLFAGCTGTPPATNNTTNGTNVAGLKDSYIIGIDNAYQPYSYQEKDGSFTGFDVESARWIANKMGFKVEFLPVAWDGIIPALQAKKIDMVY